MLSFPCPLLNLPVNQRRRTYTQCLFLGLDAFPSQQQRDKSFKGLSEVARVQLVRQGQWSIGSSGETNVAPDNGRTQLTEGNVETRDHANKEKMLRNSSWEIGQLVLCGFELWGGAMIGSRRPVSCKKRRRFESNYQRSRKAVDSNATNC